MDDWDHGPVLYFGKLNKHEKMILGSPNELIQHEASKLTQENFYNIILYANTFASWIYLPDEELPVITALNVLFSRFGYNTRAKGQLISEYSGKPVGVVH